MKKTLTLSVAAYQVEKYLAGALDSVLVPEADPRLEILVVDDGSTDHTAEIAREYETKYPDIVRLLSKTNGGYGSTINCAVQQATAVWFKTLDGDDWLDAAELRKLLDYLETAEEDMVLSNYVVVQEGTGKETKKDICFGHEPQKTIFMDQLQKENFCAEMHSMTVRTALMKQPALQLTEKCFYTDQEYVLEAYLRAQTVSFFPAVVYQYRVGRQGQSVSLIGRRKHWKDLEIILQRVQQRAQEIAVTDIQQKYLLRTMGKWIGYQVYTLMIFPPSMTAYRRLRAFWDEMQKSWPEAFQYADNHTCTCLRKTKFLAYVPLSLLLILRGDVV